MALPPEVPEYYSIVSEDWTMLEVGGGLAAVTGRKPEEMIGRDASEFAARPPGRLRAYLTGQLAAGETVDGITDLVHADGGLIPYAYKMRRVRMGGRYVFVSQGVPLSGGTVAGLDKWDEFVTRMESVLSRLLDDEYMPVARAVAYTSMSKDTLKKWADAKIIKRYGPRGKTTYKRSELDAAMERGWE